MLSDPGVQLVEQRPLRRRELGQSMLGNRMRLFDPTAPDEPSSAGEAQVFAAGPSGAASA